MRMLVVFAYLCLLAGCGQSEDRSPAASTDAPERPTVFDPLTDTLDRAQGVEDTLRESAEERRRQLEAAEGR